MTAVDGEIRAIDAGTELRLDAPAAPRVLSEIRRLTRTFVAGHGASSDVAADLELAVSELTTNVIHHTHSRSINLVLARTAGGWQLDVADAEGVPPLDELDVPSPTEPTGRGLFIAAAVMDDLTVVDVDGVSVVRCLRLDHH